MSFQKNYIPGISGLRALSIIMVLMSHWGYFHPKGIFFIINNGAFGVNVFFVISGFLITTLLMKEEVDSGKISLRNFYIRRTLRIFPAFYFLLLFYFVLQLFHVITISVPSWITSLTYTKYFPIKNGNDNYTFHFWSLSIEEHFYLIWPFLFSYLPGARKKLLIFLIKWISLLIQNQNGWKMRKINLLDKLLKINIKFLISHIMNYVNIKYYIYILDGY